MKKLLAAGLLGLSLTAGAMAAAPALAETPAALSAEKTPIADLAASPESKAALEKNFPGITAHEAYEQFKGMSLKEVQPMSGGQVIDEQIKALQADLDKLNAKNGATTK